MKSVFEADVVDALDALEAGTPLQEILSHYPEHAGELRPILETAAQLGAMPIGHSLLAQTASRDAFLRHAATLRIKEQHQSKRTLDLSRRLALSFASMVAFILLLGGLLGVAQQALPGQTLYPVKRTVEHARLSLASGPAGREALEAQFRAERREEIRALLAIGGDGRVDCAGTIEAITDDRWTVEGLVITIEPRTVIQGTPEISAFAHGTCHVGGGRVIAETIHVEGNAYPLPTPSATVTQPVTPTSTAVATPTATPTVSATPTVLASPLPQPTSTPPSVPTFEADETIEVEPTEVESDEEEDHKPGSEREDDESAEEAETEASDDDVESGDDTERDDESGEDRSDEPSEHDEKLIGEGNQGN